LTPTGACRRALELHDCRHTYASSVIASGVKAKAVSSIMGHSSIGITYDLHGHLLPGSEDEAVARLDAFCDSTVAQTVAHPAIGAS
jgi:integrase